MPASLDIAAAAIPAVSLLSLVIYLASPTTSPLRTLRTPGVALPVDDDEPLQGTSEVQDAFDLSEEKEVFCDGYPVHEDKFWRRTKSLKIAFVVTLLPAVIWNVATLTRHLAEGQGAKKQILSFLLLPAHVISLLIGLSLCLAETSTCSLGPDYTSFRSDFHSIHHTVNVHSTSVNSAANTVPRNSTHRSVNSTYLALYCHCSTSCPCLSYATFAGVRHSTFLWRPYIRPRSFQPCPRDPCLSTQTIPNVSEEVQCTVPEWLLFSYATPVVKMGNVRETMDVWDLPILPASLRASCRLSSS